MTALVVILVVLGYTMIHVGLFIYCRVQREFAPQHTSEGDRRFDKFDWEMNAIFSLIFGPMVPMVWAGRWTLLQVIDGLTRVALFFAERIQHKIDKEKRRREEEATQPKPVANSFSYRVALDDLAKKYKEGFKQ